VLRKISGPKREAEASRLKKIGERCGSLPVPMVKKFSSDHIKENEIGESYGTQWDKETFIQVLAGEVEGDSLVNLGTDG
jgi:hypothetical protein